MTGSASADQAALEPVVIDTDVLSYLFKGDTRAARYQPHLVGRAPVISFMTLAELESWADLRRWGSRRRYRLERYLADFAVHFPDRRLCRIWGAVTSAGRLAGRPIAPADAWIAATALFLAAPLITHNPSDYVVVPGLTVLSAAAP